MRLTNNKGFILPGAIVFSLILVILGISFLQYTTSFTSNLRKDYYSSLAKKAAESGVINAARCFKNTLNSDTNAWKDKELTPDKKCDFTTIENASKYISEDKNGGILRTTYSVGEPTVTDQLVTFTGKGTTELFSSETSTKAVFSQTETSKLQIPTKGEYKEIEAARGLAVTDVATGLRHTCAIANMSPYCWGMNLSKQAGTNKIGYHTEPVRITDPSNLPAGASFTDQLVDAMSAGPQQSCAITVTGKMYCWGINAPFGSLGIGNHLIPGSSTPTMISSGNIGADYPSSVKVATASGQLYGLDSQAYSCAITNGRVSCVGQNFYAQLGQIKYGRIIFPFCIDKLHTPQDECRDVHPTADFTMWQYPTGWLNYIQASDRNLYTTVFGYDKAKDLNEKSYVGKFNASEVETGQTNACVNENGKIYCWGAHSMPWVMSHNSWICFGGSIWGDIIITAEKMSFICPPTQLKRGNVIDPDGDKNNAKATVLGITRDDSSLKDKMAYGVTPSFTSWFAISNGQAHYWGMNPWNRGFLTALNFIKDYIPYTSRELVPQSVDKSYTNNRDITSISRAGHKSYGCFLASGTPFCWGRLQSEAPHINEKCFIAGQDPKTCWKTFETPAEGSYIVLKLDESKYPKLVKIPNDSTDYSKYPHAVEKIDSGDNHTCALVNGSVHCVGFNTSGQLGNGTKSHSGKMPDGSVKSVKALNIGLEPETYAATSIDSGENHSCGIVDGDVFCWGKNDRGQLGTGDTARKFRPTQVTSIAPELAKSATSVSAGKNHSCAVIEGDVYCWGDNSFGKLGDGDTSKTYSNTPVKVKFSEDVSATAVSANGDHTCAIANSRVWCWGHNDRGQLGTNNTTNYPTPRKINIGSPERQITQIAAGSNFTCAIGAERVWCWGDNSSGQLGRGDTFSESSSSIAQEVNIGSSDYNGLGFASTKLAVGDKFACTLVNKGIYCWGDNSFGQLGRGNTTNSGMPDKIVTGPGQTGGLPDFKNSASFEITAGANHACSITNGKAHCWGKNTNGQIGNGTSSTSVNPVPVTMPSNADSSSNEPYRLAAGGNHTCAIANGKIACWGLGSSGQLGSNSTATVATPQFTHNRYASGNLIYDWDRVKIF